MNLPRRPRRNRKSEAIRNMVEENTLNKSDFIFPLFLVDGQNKKVEVDSMPNIFRYSQDNLLREIEDCMKLGVQIFRHFPKPDR